MKALKWIAVLPASVLALILANLIWRLLHSITEVVGEIRTGEGRNFANK